MLVSENGTVAGVGGFFELDVVEGGLLLKLSRNGELYCALDEDGTVTRAESYDPAVAGAALLSCVTAALEAAYQRGYGDGQVVATSALEAEYQRGQAEARAELEQGMRELLQTVEHANAILGDREGEEDATTASS